MASNNESLRSCLRGMCMTMCPNTELRMRQREKLVHPLEMRLDVSGLPTKQANPQMMVKAFARSAADKIINPSDVRPLPILMKTLKYLLNSVACRKDAPWSLIYQFVTDRLWAIRQDIVVQGISNSVSTEILQAVVRFHIYAHYRMCEHQLKDYDPFCNLKHIHETIKSVIVYYKENESEVNKNVNIGTHLGYPEGWDEAISDEDTDNETDESDSQSYELKIIKDAETTEKNMKDDSQDDLLQCEVAQSSSQLESHVDASRQLESKNKQRIESDNERVWEEVNSEFSNLSLQNIGKKKKRCLVCTYSAQEEAEALYLLVFLGNDEALAHAVTLPMVIRSSELVSLALEMSLAWQAKNYHRTFQLWQFLPPLLSAAAHIHLPTIQRYGLSIMSTAYNSKALSFPVDELCLTLKFGNKDILLEDLEHYGLDTLTSGESAIRDGKLTFTKSSFKRDATVLPGRRSRWMEEQLESVVLSELLLPMLEG